MANGLADYGTFWPILAVAVHRTTGPVLELGAGDHSTPYLHFACRNRILVTAETDKAWLDKYTALYPHEYHLIPPSRVKDPRYHTGWAEWTRIEEIEWDVALVDHAPGERRAEDIKRLKSRCRLIVVHDTETDEGAGGNYGYEPVFATFKHRFEWRAYRPYTTVVSDFEAFTP